MICNAGAGYEATLNIEGGYIRQDNFIAIKNDDLGTVNVTGGTVVSNESSVQNWGEANITGGELNGVVYTSTWNDNYTGIQTNIGGSVVINGSIYTGKYSESLSSTPSVSITGGTINASFNVLNDGSKVEVSGGTFTNDPMKFVDADDNTVVSADGTYAVGSENDMSAVNSLMADAGDEVIEVYSAPNGITAPEGSTVVNKTGDTIVVNGQELKSGESMTVPFSTVQPVQGDYYILEGKDQTWTKGSNEELSFKLNSGKLIKVLIDGEEVEFEITEDGLVTIAPEVLEALEPGVHTITFVYADGGISTNIVIEA